MGLLSGGDCWAVGCSPLLSGAVGSIGNIGGGWAVGCGPLSIGAVGSKVESERGGVGLDELS